MVWAMQKYVNLVDLVNNVPRFNCRNRRRYSWERASHTLQSDWIHSFICLLNYFVARTCGTLNVSCRRLRAGASLLYERLIWSLLHCSLSAIPFMYKKKVRTKLAPMHNGQVITAKRSMAKQELRAILAECPLPVLEWLYRLVPSTGAGTVSDWLA